MRIQSINPANDKVIAEFDLWTESEIQQSLVNAETALKDWRKQSLADRLKPLSRLSEVLLENKRPWALLMTQEMGKSLKDSVAEIEKCATTVQYLSEHLPEWLSPELVRSTPDHMEVILEPMGILIGIMPWNFPFWQVLRFALPAVTIGNVVVLKHASNVFGCNQAIEQAFLKAGFPKFVFQAAMLSSKQVLKLIEEPRVRGVSLTGSVEAGRSVAEVAGRYLKKSVLELGGSDAYVILDDADLNLAVEKCVASRLVNAGQSCVSAKRFIVTEKNRQAFTKMFTEKMKHKTCGDPTDPKFDFGPLARRDLRDQLHRQVNRAVMAGAQCLLGGEIPTGPGAYYPATVLVHVDEKNPAFREELFGPVAAIIGARSEDHAIELANDSSFGLGSAVFSRDRGRALDIARHRLDSGMSFVNDFVRSDVRIPFGGVKDSGYGRELGRKGVLEFANVKSIVSV